MSIQSLGTPGTTWRNGVPVAEAVALARATFTPSSRVFTDFPVRLASGGTVCFGVDCFGEEYERLHSSGPLRGSPFDRRDVLPERLEIALGSGAPSVQVEAAILSMQVQEDIQDLLVRVCVPDAHSRVKTGVCVDVGDWGAPVETCATYHVDATSVARDLALSWIHLHEGSKIPRSAGMSLDSLRALIDAAPHGASVGIAGDVDLVRRHMRMDWAAAASRDTRPTRADGARRGARAVVEGDAELMRETVLKAIDTPPSLLLDALEASAVPDDEWRTVESPALETIAATNAGAPRYEVDVTSRKHVQFIERHAPYHVRRLASGGVVLATHPYRTLWPLWADALFLLGIPS
ncbi:hypothetical protein [Sorangium cellulosum]|uniref:hypothetical protein n=1 Tax=Sorangium cellulosum TaxID=56 RepID=UPI001F3078F2|nr:hypothetical protein [Sorangium cellulosum]